MPGAFPGEPLIRGLIFNILPGVPWTFVTILCRFDKKLTVCNYKHNNHPFRLAQGIVYPVDSVTYNIHIHSWINSIANGGSLVWILLIVPFIF